MFCVVSVDVGLVFCVLVLLVYVCVGGVVVD